MFVYSTIHTLCVIKKPFNIIEMNKINFHFRHYLLSLKDLYKTIKESSIEERRDFFMRLKTIHAYPSALHFDNEYLFKDINEKGLFPFPFIFIPPSEEYFAFIVQMAQWPFDEYLKVLEEKFEVNDNYSEGFSPGEKQISTEVRHLSMQFARLSEASAKLEQEVFKISFIKDLPKNVIGHITEDGTFKFVEPETNKEWKVTNLEEKEGALKNSIKNLIESNKGNKNNFIKKLNDLINAQNTN